MSPALLLRAHRKAAQREIIASQAAHTNVLGGGVRYQRPVNWEPWAQEAERRRRQGVLFETRLLRLLGEGGA